MRIAVSVLAILFALLHIVAAAAQFKSKVPAARGFAVAMACGGAMIMGLFSISLGAQQETLPRWPQPV